MNTKSSNININYKSQDSNSNQRDTISDSKLAQFNLFFEYDNSVSEVRKNIRDRAIR